MIVVEDVVLPVPAGQRPSIKDGLMLLWRGYASNSYQQWLLAATRAAWLPAMAFPT